MSEAPQRQAKANENGTNQEPLWITSCMAPVADRFVRALADLIGRRLALETRYVQELPWQQREQWLDEGRVQLGWVCGLPYVWKTDDEAQRAPLDLLVAPVMAGRRYGERPVYFSDLVVRQDSRFERFEALRGASWAFNEPRSHSGYLLTRYQLALRGLNGDYFGRVVGAGSHERALQMIVAREIDAAAIDSTVLELVLEQQPELRKHIRILESWGPSPIPPWLVHRRTAPALREALQKLLLQLHEDNEGRTVLRLGHMARFVTVRDEDYDPIRHMARRAQDVSLGEHS